MIKSDQLAEDLREAIGVALAAGVSENEIVSMVATVAADAEQPELPGFEDPGLPIYDELPDGLIDLPEAARKYGCSNALLHRWIDRGHLKEQGRLKAPARGGGYIVVYESELKHRLAKTPQIGRPKKRSN